MIDEHAKVLTVLTAMNRGTGSVHELVFDERQPVPSVHSLIFRTVLVSPSLRLCFPIDVKAKVKRSSIEVLSKTYRTSIDDLSNIYRRPIEDLSKKGWRGSGESRGRFWLQSYKIPKPHIHLFGR